MKQFGLALGLLLLISCSNNSKEKQNEAAYDMNIAPDFEFKMVGEEKEDNTKIVTKIEVLKKGQNTVVQVLDGFQAEVAKNEMPSYEDLNFDTFKDLRLMQFLPTDESIAYFYWLYDFEKEKFIRNTQLEEKVFSPSISQDNKHLVSQWRKKNGTFGSDTFKFISAFDFKLVQQEKYIPYQDSLYKQYITVYNNGTETTKESIYKPEVRIPLPF
jgi:hypothetical protein